MKFTVTKPVEIEVTHVKIEVPVNYGEEDIPNDFPGREGNVWKATVEMDTGRILNWPKGREADFQMKVCDGGIYHLLRCVKDREETIAVIDCDYVPNDLIPGEYGDYIELSINADGIITNWQKHPRISAFFRSA